MVSIVFWIAALFAEIIGTMAGFGSSTIFLPIALFFFEFQTALVLVAIFHLSGNIGRITFFRHGFNKKLLIFFGIPSVLLGIVGAFLVKYTSQPILKIILGIFLIIFVIVSWDNTLKIKPSLKNSILGGGISGFFAGLIGTGGALRGAFLTSFRLRKTVYIATAAAISLAVDITRIPVYIGSGFLSYQLLYLIPGLFTVALIGSYSGKKIIHKVPQKIFRKIVLSAICLVSLKFILEGIKYFL